MTNPHISHLGGSMYGDGEVVVEFENVDSAQAPMTATVLTPGRHGAYLDAYRIANLQSKRPSVKLAAHVISLARAEDKKRGIVYPSEVGA